MVRVFIKNPDGTFINNIAKESRGDWISLKSWGIDYPRGSVLADQDAKKLFTDTPNKIAFLTSSSIS